MSLLNCLSAAIPARERVVTCEEGFELLPEEASVVVMVNAGDAEAVPATDLWRGIVTVLYPDGLPTW
jgi:Flp pilus assembly CpaF family ATPase